MNIKNFSTIGYFIKNYFNGSMDYSDLESCIDDFFKWEKRETVEAFKNEIETMFILRDPDLFREVFFRLGDRGIPTKKAIPMVELLFTRAWEHK